MPLCKATPGDGSIDYNTTMGKMGFLRKDSTKEFPFQGV
jgi:hypothetical protein